MVEISHVYLVTLYGGDISFVPDRSLCWRISHVYLVSLYGGNISCLSGKFVWWRYIMFTLQVRTYGGSTWLLRKLQLLSWYFCKGEIPSVNLISLYGGEI